MDRLFEESFIGPRRREWSAPAEGTLALDMYQTEDSILTLTIPKVAEAKPKVIKIKGQKKQDTLHTDCQFKRSGPSGPLLRLSVRHLLSWKRPATNP
jgi:6-phosphogluconolactonase/glucosamine-6-phosphate isomerase/deaminase